MSGPAEILCSRCGTPFPKEKGKAAVTCVVCGQLRPDLDLTLDDDEDDDLASGLSTSAGGGATSGGGRPSPLDSDMPVLRVASPPTSPHDDSLEPTRQGGSFRAQQPYMALRDTPAPTMFGGSGQGAESPDRLMDRIGVVPLVVCPLAVGMAGALNMLSRTDDFSTGTWYAVGSVFMVMLATALFLGLAASGFLYLVRIRWTFVIRMIFVAAAGAVCYFGLKEIPSHIQVRQDDLPGIVLRR